MSLRSAMISAAERVPLPDTVTRVAIERMCARTAVALSEKGTAAAEFALTTARRGIAEQTEKANKQHYEVPAAFFSHVLGPKRKYSCCYYSDPRSTLEEAEAEALKVTIAHAGLADRQSILDLGCGWGALALLTAQQFPYSFVTAVSNSNSQRVHIERERGSSD